MCLYFIAPTIANEPPRKTKPSSQVCKPWEKNAALMLLKTMKLYWIHTCVDLTARNSRPDGSPVFCCEIAHTKPMVFEQGMSKVFTLVRFSFASRKMPASVNRAWKPKKKINSYKPVAVVPMLDPSVRGYMRSMWMTPTPTSGVKALVKMDELCTNTVIPAPSRIATYLKQEAVRRHCGCDVPPSLDTENTTGKHAPLWRMLCQTTKVRLLLRPEWVYIMYAYIRLKRNLFTLHVLVPLFWCRQMSWLDVMFQNRTWRHGLFYSRVNFLKDLWRGFFRHWSGILVKGTMKESQKSNSGSPGSCPAKLRW